MNAILRFSVSILAGLEGLLMVFGHPDWAVALWSAAAAAAQSSRPVVQKPWR